MNSVAHRAFTFLKNSIEQLLSRHVAYVMNSVAHRAFTFLKNSIEQLVTSRPSFKHFLGSCVSPLHSMNSLFWTSHALPRCMAPARSEGVPRGTSCTVSSSSVGSQMSLVSILSSLVEVNQAILAW